MLIDVKDLTKVYEMGDVQVHALRGVSFTITEGEFLAIMGPSGSGKSTIIVLQTFGIRRLGLYSSRSTSCLVRVRSTTLNCRLFTRVWVEKSGNDVPLRHWKPSVWRIGLITSQPNCLVVKFSVSRLLVPWLIVLQ